MPSCGRPHHRRPDQPRPDMGEVPERTEPEKPAQWTIAVWVWLILLTPGVLLILAAVL